MDTDGILSPGEIPNPRIDYGNGRYPDRDWNRDDDYHDHGRDDCSPGRRRDLPRPRIDIDRVKSTGNFFGDKAKVRGTVEGVCIQEAGLFQNGRLVQRIPVRTSSHFDRFEFEVKADMGEHPEVRAYNTEGDREIVDVE
jgi:hypothetical protein